MSNDYLMKHIQLASLGVAQLFNLEEVVHEITDPYDNEAAMNYTSGSQIC